AGVLARLAPFLFGQEKPVLIEAEEIEDTPAPAPDPEPAPAPPPAAPVPAPAPAPSLLDSILDDPMLLAGGGGIAVLLLGFAAYRMRQQRKDGEGSDGAPSMLSEDQTGSHSVFGVQGGQSV
ncbi:MAG TPA: hypothetical protein PLR02_14020, partial [Rhodocyclaceae bacterium]|nr:hypothetical protein [Rhodocyclaceae bacterium]